MELCAENAFDANWVRTTLKQRNDEGQRFQDVLLRLADGAIIRVRRNNPGSAPKAHGFYLRVHEVLECSRPAALEALQGVQRIHCCSDMPCPEVDCLHATAVALVPRAKTVDVGDLDGRGPGGRCCVVTST